MVGTEPEAKVKAKEAVAKVEAGTEAAVEDLRARGGAAPAVLALGFLSAAASAFAPLVMVSAPRLTSTSLCKIVGLYRQCSIPGDAISLKDLPAFSTFGEECSVSEITDDGIVNTSISVHILSSW